MIKRGTLCTILGLLLLLAALLLTAYNLRRDAAAGDAAELVLERLIPDLPRQESLSQSPTGEGKEEAFVPDYVLNPELPMPEREIDGQSYIGVLDIPALGLSLPIISTWSYPGLQIAPCRYSGSAYLENLVIAGHNYRSHFASLTQLQPGDAVTFTDMDGTVFRYKVDSLETLSPYAISDMTSGGWPVDTLHLYRRRPVKACHPLQRRLTYYKNQKSRETPNVPSEFHGFLFCVLLISS